MSKHNTVFSDLIVQVNSFSKKFCLGMIIITGEWSLDRMAPYQKFLLILALDWICVLALDQKF